MRAVVTGAARGIGAAVADRLAAADFDVLRVDIDPSVDGLVADVTSPDDRARIVEAAGEVSVLVNNAGITRDARIVKMTEEDFLRVIRVNLGAAYELTRACTFADGASVVSLASRAYLGNYKALTVPTDAGFGLNGNSPELVAAIEAAVADGMDVINLSLGEVEIEPTRDLVARALDAAAAAGVVPVVAAGNELGDYGRGSIVSPGTSAG